MSWDPVAAISGGEPLYLGPLDDNGKKTSDNKLNDRKVPIRVWYDASTAKQPEEIGQRSAGQKDDLETLPTWSEFTQKTTFHGVRYIFDGTPFKIRRFVIYFLDQIDVQDTSS